MARAFRPQPPEHDSWASELIKKVSDKINFIVSELYVLLYVVGTRHYTERCPDISSGSYIHRNMGGHPKDVDRFFARLILYLKANNLSFLDIGYGSGLMAWLMSSKFGINVCGIEKDGSYYEKKELRNVL